MLDAYSTVQIIGRDPSGNWYRILYPRGIGGEGWVTSQYVNVQNQESVPILPSASGAGFDAVITQKVNVRSGPGTDAGTLQILNARDVVSVLGKDPTGQWLQIRFSEAAAGTGWVAAGYVQANGLEQFPIIGQSGQIIGTETATSAAPTPEATPAVAAMDNDSASAPAVDIALSPSGAESFLYTSDLSAPQGDTTDWIRFTADMATLELSITCTGAGKFELSISPSGVSLTEIEMPGCGGRAPLRLIPHQSYLLKLAVQAQGGIQAYLRYTITVVGTP